MARLSASDWLDHGLDALSRDGFVALKADVLANSLGVSRGSFYHHFTDLADYHRAVLQHWLEVTVLAVVERLEGESLTALDRLDALIDLASEDPGGIEYAVRAWAFSDPAVHEVVAEVDRQRIDYIAELFREHGDDDASARTGAHLLYMTGVGYSLIGDRLTEAESSTARESLKAMARDLAG